MLSKAIAPYHPRNSLDQAMNWLKLHANTDPVLKKLFADSFRFYPLLNFIAWALNRRCLQAADPRVTPLPSLTETDGLNWLDAIDDNDLSLILIRAYQQSAWSELMQLIVRLLELRFLHVSEGREN